MLESQDLLRRAESQVASQDAALRDLDADLQSNRAAAEDMELKLVSLTKELQGSDALARGLQVCLSPYAPYLT